MPTTISDKPVQKYDAYTATDYRIWRLLAQRQTEALKPVAAAEYLRCLNELYPILSPEHPPRFSDLSRALREAHGWSIEVVKGFLPVDEFFALLSRRRFCSSTWLRNENQLDYLEEPDMFHDIFGHIPLYLNKNYADFAQQLGALGVKYAGDEHKITKLQRLYWFTIEFGVMRQRGELKVYGAGICSSPQETKHIFENKEVQVVDFDLDQVMAQEFVIDKVQMKYFAIDSFASLYSAVDALAERWG
ncbi:phenylalanine 4-hydroxylase [Neolewinella xylanilytica]|uniref:Phenylalanine 4-hydroxylase n=1 Tax=Neolewinella xylanilytica TaxID=1514080 RepID=A0A2S6IA08_9BACT|nr:phenylalanine 4-monooxygenase [Neolewinella xylanilytica]PPK88333.1 phenylalanine 4-hydroxylase [Neolewinella xylanilytica]